MNKSLILKAAAVVTCLAVLIGMAFGVHNSLAYLSDNGGKVKNTFTFGNASVKITETFNPPTLKTGDNSYVKKVAVTNNGTVPEYVRVWLAFSNGDVENISVVSCDNGTTWYKLSELKNHLPQGWVYKDSGVLGGYYYYTGALAVGASTPNLITNVKTTFIEKTADTNETINQTVRDYDILVYTEGVQQMKLDGSGLNNSYETAWTEFLGFK